MWCSAFSKSLACCIVFLAASVPANASTLRFEAALSGVNEVPSNASPATGFTTVTLDDVADTLHVLESFSGLLSPSIAAHIHCCALPGNNAPIVLPFTSGEGFPFGNTSGTFDHIFNLNTDLTGISVSAFIAGLEGGQAYANIHTSGVPTGEIRGWLVTPLPTALPLFATGLGGLVLLGWRRKKKIGSLSA